MSIIKTLLEKNNHLNPVSYFSANHFIHGEWSAPSDKQYIDVVDPGSEEIFSAIADGSIEDAEKAIASSSAAFSSWRKMAPPVRASIMMKLSAALSENEQLLSVTECLDSGKPYSEAVSDIRTAALQLAYYAGIADKIEGETIPLGTEFVSYNSPEPVGVTVHVIPWNFPLLTAIRGLAPALAAGCTAIIKPSETTSLSALLMAEIFVRAGLPKGVVNVVTGYGAKIGNYLTSHPLVRHVTFTGSVVTGQNVMRSAASNVSSLTLELGGKSPAIVMSDADLDHVADDMIGAIFYNSGQVCSAGSRLVIHKDRHGEFMEKFLPKVAKLSIGHGLKDQNIGAITSEAHLNKISRFLEDARHRGLDILCGGRKTVDPESGKGFFFEPTVIDRLNHDDDIVQKEIFGPVLAVQIMDHDDDALTLANGTEFGLAACIYSKDVSKAMRLSSDIDAGQVTINQYFAGGIYTPFGGTKMSGFGREKGLAGLASYLRTKNITIKL